MKVVQGCARSCLARASENTFQTKCWPLCCTVLSPPGALDQRLFEKWVFPTGMLKKGGGEGLGKAAHFDKILVESLFLGRLISGRSKVFFCLAPLPLPTLTSLNKEVRPFFLGDNSIWSLITPLRE